MIPHFKLNGVLPPYLGPRGNTTQRSPYKVPIQEFAAFFCTSKARLKILDGFLRYRQALRDLGVVGIQWVDGSFVENVLSPREPADVDVLTIYENSVAAMDSLKQAEVYQHFDRDEMKPRFLCDAFGLSIHSPLFIRELLYWHSLFSHRRNHVWKGFVEIELTSEPGGDELARNVVDAIRPKFEQDEP